MIKPLLSFFIMIAFFGNAYGDIRPQGISGSADKRTVIGWTGVRPDYVSPSTPNIWNTSPYNSIVKVELDEHYGTGEFISPKHVLTNVHVAEKCGTDGKPNCEIHTSDNKVIQAKAVLWGIDSLYDGNGWDKWRENEDKDWTILEITDNYCRAEYRKIGDSTQHMEGLWRAGFGSLRVLSREDIAAIRMAYIAYLRAGGSGSSYGMLIDDHDQDYVNKYKAFTDEFSRITGKDFWRDYDSDVNTLKLTQNCRFSGQDGAFQFAVLHTCDNWGGDSGSSIKRMSGDHVVGINTGGWYYITTNNDDDAVNLGIISSGFFDAKMSNLLKKAEQECKNWKPDDPEPIKPQPIKPEPDKCKLSCDNYVLDVNAGNPCSSVMPELHKQCRDATGKDMTYSMNFRYICVGYDKSPACTGQTITPITPLPGDDKCEWRCDKYELDVSEGACYHTELTTLDKQCEQATGKKMVCKNYKCICVDYDKSPVCRGQTITPEPIGRKVGGQCLSSDLPAHATDGHYISGGTKKFECETGKCSCAATACESGFYLAANSNGWSMGWCRSGTCPHGKHANIVGGNKMTGCVDD